MPRVNDPPEFLINSLASWWYKNLASSLWIAVMMSPRNKSLDAGVP